MHYEFFDKTQIHSNKSIKRSTMSHHKLKIKFDLYSLTHFYMVQKTNNIITINNFTSREIRSKHFKTPFRITPLLTYYIVVVLSSILIDVRKIHVSIKSFGRSRFETIKVLFCCSITQFAHKKKCTAGIIYDRCIRIPTQVH